MAFTPTPEQTDIVSFAKETKDNLIVRALAGTAKTSTLVLIAKALSTQPILCLAFNKRIASEMQERLPGNCTSQTLNSLGHQAWSKALGRRLRVDAKKIYNIVKGLIEDLPKNQQTLAWEEYGNIRDAISLAKSCGFIPYGHFDQGKPLYSDDDFYAGLDPEPTALTEKLIHKAVLKSLEQSFQGTIDFNDQILMPTLFPCSFPQFPVVMIDEAQDLSALNHVMLTKIARKRLIAVGDPCQAIYAFRGAHESSMEEMTQRFTMTRRQLTVSFRCPKAVVREARFRAPQMQWPEWAAEGEVLNWPKWRADDLPPAAAIICRNNAPLFSMAIRLLAAGRSPKIIGNDITKGIVKQLRKLGDTSMGKDELFEAISQWQVKTLTRAKNKALVEDKAACFRIFAEQSDTLGGAIAYAEHVLSAEGPIQLMTGHKSKGLEFNDVVFLDQHLVKDEGQDRNLRYVIITRAMKRLIYATSEGMQNG